MIDTHAATLNTNLWGVHNLIIMNSSKQQISATFAQLQVPEWHLKSIYTGPNFYSSKQWRVVWPYDQMLSIETRSWYDHVLSFLYRKNQYGHMLCFETGKINMIICWVLKQETYVHIYDHVLDFLYRTWKWPSVDKLSVRLPVGIAVIIVMLVTTFLMTHVADFWAWRKLE